MRARTSPSAGRRWGSAVQINECQVLATQRGADWWVAFRHKFEPSGRIVVVTASPQGDLCEVVCTDDAEARWWAGWAEQAGVPASALKVLRAGARRSPARAPSGGSSVPDWRHFRGCSQDETAVNNHEVVVEIYDGIALSMKCIPCRARIPIRPERAAARLVDLAEQAREHTGAVARLDRASTRTLTESQVHSLVSEAISQYRENVDVHAQGEEQAANEAAWGVVDGLFTDLDDGAE